MSDTTPGDDALLSATDREEAFSRAYISALAAGAGYTTAQPDLDRDSVDVIVCAGGDVRPQVAAQLKATINLREVSGDYRFTLKMKNYNDLRVPTMVPRILVVLHLPRDEPDWLTIAPDQLTLRHCAYWTSLRGQPEVIGQDTVTVPVPSANLLTVASLKDLMAQARQGFVE
ncbi:DUF4365 domain-containing protein [Phenylobacterium sp.]|uniref:DUF4365 domain-containing protein n=1 Tax=Phenylobacterium sp. TaxID=1871053 RepID=UPI002E33E81C|nr:DUF4365 domain-containing protein [Phenylobacterium sp.]HEX4710442.1 DUF4365 domain-containing protein [Phenylobacterium sp.]